MFKFFFFFFFWHSAHEFEPQIPDEFKQIGQSWAEFEFIINQILLMFNVQHSTSVSTYHCHSCGCHPVPLPSLEGCGPRLPTSTLADDDDSALSTTPPSLAWTLPSLEGCGPNYQHWCSLMMMTWTTTTTPPAMIINNKGDNQQDNKYWKLPATCDGDRESPW